MGWSGSWVGMVGLVVVFLGLGGCREAEPEPKNTRHALVFEFEELPVEAAEELRKAVQGQDAVFRCIYRGKTVTVYLNESARPAELAPIIQAALPRELKLVKSRIALDEPLRSMIRKSDGESSGRGDESTDESRSGTRRGTERGTSRGTERGTSRGTR